MLPNVSCAVLRYSQPVILKTVTRTSVDFQKTTSVETESITATVQPLSREKLKTLDIDRSLDYKWFHSTNAFDIGQYIEYKGKNYRLIERAEWQDYGYFEAVGEEHKKELI